MTSKILGILCGVVGLGFILQEVWTVAMFLTSTVTLKLNVVPCGSVPIVQVLLLALGTGVAVW